MVSLLGRNVFLAISLTYFFTKVNLSSIPLKNQENYVAQEFVPAMPIHMVPLWIFLSKHKNSSEANTLMKMLGIPPKSGYLKEKARCRYNGECRKGCCLSDGDEFKGICQNLSTDELTCQKAQRKNDVYFVSCPCAFNPNAPSLNGYRIIRVANEEFIPDEQSLKESSWLINSWPYIQIVNGKESIQWKYLFENQTVGETCLFNLECESRCCVIRQRNEFGRCSALSLPGERCSFGRLKGGSYKGFCPCASQESDCESRKRITRGKGVCRASKQF